MHLMMGVGTVLLTSQDLMHRLQGRNHHVRHDKQHTGSSLRKQRMFCEVAT